MNIHKSRIYNKVRKLKIFPLGMITKPAEFCDIVNEKGHHVCCIVSMTSEDTREELQEKNIKNECVIWDKEGFPDIYIKYKLIDLKAIKRGIKLLQQDKHNKFDYNLVIEKVPFLLRDYEDEDLSDVWLPFDKKKLDIARELFKDGN